MKARWFENKWITLFWVMVAVVFFAGGWIIALIFAVMGAPFFAGYMLLRGTAIYGNNNWGGQGPHDQVTPKEMHRK